MHDHELNIEEMVLRIPGVNEQEAQVIGQDVVKHIADNFPASYQNRNLEALDLKVTVSQGTSGKEMTKIIAEAIMKGLV